MNEIHYVDIARRAYEIWERQGRPHGRDLAHWFEAERELNAMPRTGAIQGPEMPQKPESRKGTARGSRGAARTKRS
jgi:hypothetical protein